jgi:hypothetical protein
MPERPEPEVELKTAKKSDREADVSVKNSEEK